MRRTELLKKKKRYLRRVFRVRKKIFGTPERPRLAVYRSLRHIYALLIDDVSGRTLTSVSTLTPEIREQIKGMKKTEQAAVVGRKIAEKAKALGIERVVFDRRGFKYHGRVKSLADAAREGGLKF
ncbi:MAG TPA: 50S ribosomal protein L18 [candidate division Zixibacteria bacterium]|nr:50S ribosomal protein L18 [candidate division Zixibacteria bacterium]